VDYDQAIRLDPNDAHTFNNRGNAYAAKKNYARAIADYDQAVRPRSNSSATLYRRGKVKQFSGDNAGGDADIAAAKKINPNIGR